MKNSLSAVVLAFYLLGGILTAQEKSATGDNLPAQILEGLKMKFPKAVVQKWTKEQEGETVLYDIEFEQNGKKLEADIRADGTIDNWERAIAVRTLPAIVRRTVEKKYPKSVMKEVMEMNDFKNGKDVLKGYEIVLKTGKQKDREITVGADGAILEDGGEEK